MKLTDLAHKNNIDIGKVKTSPSNPIDKEINGETVLKRATKRRPWLEGLDENSDTTEQAKSEAKAESISSQNDDSYNKNLQHTYKNLPENYPQSDYKVVANQEQSGSKLEAKSSSKVVANQEQSGSKLGALKIETGSKVVAKPVAETSSKLVAKWKRQKDPNTGVNQEHIGNRSHEEIVEDQSFKNLVGLQRDSLLVVYGSIRKNGQDSSEPLSINFIANSCQSSIPTTKNALRRLQEKKLLLRKEYKNGRGGWTVYRLPKKLYLEILDCENNGANLTIKLTQSNAESGSKVVAETGSKVVAKPVANPPSSSRLNTNTNSLNSTTTELGQVGEYWLAWDRINFEGLTELNCPFGKKQIEQIKAWGVSPESLQESIHNFIFALKKNWTPEGGFKSSPLNYFMGCIRTNGLFEYDGYYQHRRQLKEIERAQLAKKTNDVEAIEAEIRRTKVRFWLKSLSEESKRIYHPYILNLGENTEFGSSKHADFIVSNLWNQIERQVNEVLDATDQNSEVAQHGQKGH
jgi:hypothetical protein